MAGKPTLPPDVDKRMNAKGAADAPPGIWNALDQERAASMADEGGASGAYMERQEPIYPRIGAAWYRRPVAIGAFLGGAALITIGGIMLATKLRK